MAIILITDPNDSSVAGGLSNPDPVSWEQVLQGGFLNLTIDEFTSSEDVKNLFNLNPPPTFFGPFMVWGEFDSDSGSLSLWLAPTTGDRDAQFAVLDNFKAGAGTGTLFRDNKLPPSINWAVNL